MSPQDIITSEEIANVLHVKTTTLYDYRWRKQSKCPLFKQGRRLFSFKPDFDRWYKERLEYV